MLEVIGVQNALHLGQCQVGFSSPIRLCQGKYEFHFLFNIDF